MATSGTEKYSRILLILVKGGTKVTRTFFEKRVKDLSPDGTEQSTDAFLLKNKSEVLSEKPGKNKEHIYFPKSGHTDLEQWDLAMFCFILLEICSLTSTIKMRVEKLQKIRNKLCHVRDPTLDDGQFQDYNAKIKLSFKCILEEIGDQKLKFEIKAMRESFISGPLTLEDTISIMHQFYRMELDQKEKLEKISTAQDEMNAKLDRQSEQLQDIAKRLPQGTAVDVPDTSIVIEVKNCSKDKEKEVLDVLVKHFNHAIKKTESALEEDLPNGALHAIREAVYQVFKDFLNMGRHIVEVEQKCLLLTIKCTSVDSFIQLLQDYRTDALTEQLSKLEIAIRLMQGCEEVKLETAIYKDEFLRVMDDLILALDRQVQPRDYTLQPFMSYSNLSSLSINTTQTRVNGFGDIHLADGTAEDAGSTANSIRLTIKCATLSHRKQLQEYFETVAFRNGMKRIETEIGKQLNITNLLINAHLVKADDCSDRSCSSSLVDSKVNIDNDNIQEADTVERAAGNERHRLINNSEIRELHSDVNSSSDKTTCDFSKDTKEEHEAEGVTECKSQPSDNNFDEFQSDHKSQSNERMCEIDDLLYQSKTSMMQGDQKMAKELALEAKVCIDREKEKVVVAAESAASDEQLSDWYFECFWCLFPLQETAAAARCYYTAIVFDPEWDYDEHRHLSEMLWGPLVYFNFTSSVAEICQDVDPLLEELDRLAQLAEERKQWSVCNAIDGDIETTYYVLNRLKRFRMKSYDDIKLPKRKEAFRRMGRCYLHMGLHHDARKACITILQDMCEYDDSEALEIWARSLFETGDLVIALEKSNLALKYCQNANAKERLLEFQKGLSEEIEKGRTPATNVPDGDWLEGTHAKSMSFRTWPERKKRRHKRPKARQQAELMQSTTETVLDEKEAGTPSQETSIIYVRKLQSYESESSNTQGECSIRTNTVEKVWKSETDHYTDTGENDSISSDLDQNLNEDKSSFYEQSLKHRETSSQTEKLLKEGVRLSYSYLKKFEDKHSKVLDRPQFYNDLLPNADLKKLVSSNSKKYVKCIIQFVTSHEAYCKPVDSSKLTSLIEISGRSKIGCEVFNEDEVVVEILDTREKKEKRYGKVLGVLNRRKHANIKHPVFLCTLDDMESHLVRPICKTVPKIHVLTKEITQKFEAKQERAYKLELYEYDAEKELFCNPQIKQINPADQGSYILLVAYIHWGTRHIYPRGAVIRIFPEIKTLSTGLQLLNLQYETPSLYDKATAETVQNFIEKNGEGFEQHMLDNRKDLTEMNIFTVSQTDLVDMNYAFSIENFENGYKVGVHVIDVSAIVKKDSPIDKEAQQRAVTFHSGIGKKRYLLPEPLSEDICCLIPNKTRLTISVFMFVSNNGKPMQREGKNYEVVLSYIKSKRHVIYASTEEMVSSQETDDEIRNDVSKLFKISSKMKCCRSECEDFEPDMEYFDDLKGNSKTEPLKTKGIIEEVLIMANRKITKHLLGIYRDRVPLLYTPPPSDESIEDFLKNAEKYTDVILKLQNKRIGGTIPNVDECVGKKSDRSVILSKDVWTAISEAPKEAAKYIQNDDLHSIQLTTFISWLMIQNKPEYILSGALKSKGLGIRADTTFTSPVHSYMDIVVQRLVHASVAYDRNDRKCPYMMEEIERICIHVNSMRVKGMEFKKACNLLKLATQLRNSPLMVNAFVNKVSDRGVSLCSRLLKNAPAPERDLAFSLLGVAKKPKEFVDKITNWKKVKTVWKKRIYDFHVTTDIPDDRVNKFKLNPYKDVVFIQLQEWARMLKSSIEGRTEDLSRAIRHAKVSDSNDGLDDVSTECFKLLDIKPNTTFSTTFFRGKMVKVQISAEHYGGMLSPKLMLYNMTNNVKFCLQHPDDPVLHLTRYATRSSCDQYNNVHDYLGRWEPIMAMESATGTVKNEENFCINNVPVEFNGRKGKFVLDLTACEMRNIEFSGTVSEGEDGDKDLEDDTIGTPSYDWLCLKATVHNTGRQSEVTKNTNTSFDSVWVGHAQITKVSRTKDAQSDGKLSVSFTLHNRTVMPKSQCELDKKLSVEVLRKLEVDRRTESFIKTLPKLEETLAGKIALNKPIPSLDKRRIDFANLIDKDLFYDASIEDLRRKPLPKNNEKQKEAIDKALKSSFSLIQGPPGTGKTNTGIKLIYLFNKINDISSKEGKKRKQVLFCGPSNKSVDLVAEWMLNRMGNHRPNFVRVYGRSIETIDFPVPGRTFQSQRSTRSQITPPHLYQVALHHLIRQKGKKHAEEISKMDKMFKDTNYAPMPVQVKKYVHLVREASIDEIRKHDVILCTTAVGTNPKVLSASSVYQVIVDEAGMCPEPQCLVPIIATKAEQVVLIGDHKQLRPIVMCKEAASLGLETSLFERYAKTKSSKNFKFTMLEEQYRMHPQICAFPSEQFYGNKLLTKRGLWFGESLDIWPNKDYPFVLVHVEGQEEMLTVSTEDGNEQSRSNAAEIDHVVKVYAFLAKKTCQNKASIHILSQYNAQCSEIRRKLQSTDDQVSTVVSSQGGEWDYVIFSTVRSLPDYKIESNPTIGWCQHNLGFITDKNQVNVAITRARKGLIIIGNRKLLECDSVWKRLIEKYERHGCIMTPDQFPPSNLSKECYSDRNGRYGDSVTYIGASFRKTRPRHFPK